MTILTTSGVEMALDQNGDILKKSYNAIIETFSIWAAASFVVSGFVSALSFTIRFRMNYFMVAQPSDIVMGGFINVAAVLVIAVLFLTGFYIQYNIPRFIRYMHRKSLDRHYDHHIFCRRQYKHRTFIRFAFPLACTVYVIGLLTAAYFDVSPVYRDHTGVHFSDMSFKSYWERPLPTIGADNLYLSSSADQFAVCGNAPVLWMGAASVILNCRGRARLIQNTENLLLDRFTPNEIERMQQAERSKAEAAAKRVTAAHGKENPVKGNLNPSVKVVRRAH